MFPGPPPAAILDGLPPILDARVETLILGSFPSPASLAAKQYYAHPQNQFWRLIGALVGEALVPLSWREKQACLLRHRLGIWDVYRHCSRLGALDSAIRSAQANDFSRLPGEAPQLRRVVFNGKISGRFERYFREQGYATCVLPSSSPAYTLSFERKRVLWQAGLTGS